MLRDSASDPPQLLGKHLASNIRAVSLLEIWFLLLQKKMILKDCNFNLVDCISTPVMNEQWYLCVDNRHTYDTVQTKSKFQVNRSLSHDWTGSGRSRKQYALSTINLDLKTNLNILLILLPMFQIFYATIKLTLFNLVINRVKYNKLTWLIKGLVICCNHNHMKLDFIRIKILQVRSLSCAKFKGNRSKSSSGDFL